MGVLAWLRGSPETAPVQQRRFTAARVDRYSSGFATAQESINNELRADLDALRARSRHLVKNNALARKYAQMVVANVAGPSGFVLQSRAQDARGGEDRAAAAAVERAWADWCETGVCDLGGGLSFAALCRGVAASLAADGEFLLHLVRGERAENRHGLAVQWLDIDRLDTRFNRAPRGGENAVVMGVEINATGRPLAYHLLTQHPQERGGTRERQALPAADVLHGFAREHAEQQRGVPWMAAAVLPLHHLDEFERSALLAARNGADRLGFFISPDGAPPPLGGETGADGEPIRVSVPGSYDTLPPGYDYKPGESAYPDAMMEAFSKLYLRRVASALGVSYNALGNDLEGVSYSSIRQGALDERDQWMARQQIVIETLCVPLFRAWLAQALPRGVIRVNGKALTADDQPRLLPHHWQGRRWQWVDPLKDINAAREAVRMGVNSPQRIAAQMGLDVADVLADLRAFEAQAQGIGLIDYGSGGDRAQDDDDTGASPSGSP